jgi:hypothetical protein
MSTKEFLMWLNRWKNMLIPGGAIIISDLIPKKSCSMLDLASLLAFSFRNRILFSAVWRGLKEFKLYAKMRRVQPLLHISRNGLSHMSAQAGLNISFLPQNITFRQSRITGIFSKEKNNVNHTNFKF